MERALLFQHIAAQIAAGHYALTSLIAYTVMTQESGLIIYLPNVLRKVPLPIFPAPNIEDYEWLLPASRAS